MSGSRHDWLDDHTAERLLRGEPVDPGNAPAARASEPLVELLTAAAAAGVGRPDSAREEAVLAAFRAAEREPVPSELREVPGGRAGVRRAGGLRGLPGSAKAAVAAAFAATALVGGVAAAAGTGVIPSPFTSKGDPVTTPSSGTSAPSTDGTAGPRAPQSTDTPSPSPSPSAPPSASGTARGGGGTPSARTPGGTADHDRTSNGHVLRDGHGPGGAASGDPADSKGPAKRRHTSLSGLTGELTYALPDTRAQGDAPATTARTAHAAHAPVTSKPQQAPRPAAPQVAQRSQPRPQDQQARHARHAKRPRHAKPSSPRLTSRFRTGSGHGGGGL